MKQRHILRKEWSSLRTAIAAVIIEHNIEPDQFRPLSIQENWKEIEDNIYQKFCAIIDSGERPVWLWEYFKMDWYSVQGIGNSLELFLDNLIDPQEAVWYLAEETVNGKSKLWLYEGKIKSIQKVISETWLHEFYMVSKKYEWLICLNHHDSLIATGGNMSGKLRELDSK